MCRHQFSDWCLVVFALADTFLASMDSFAAWAAVSFVGDGGAFVELVPNRAD